MLKMLRLSWSNSAVVEAIKRKNQGLSHLWILYDEIENLEDMCHRFIILKIGRENNKAANTLAAVARQ
jgi:hypothetical protein